MITAVKRHLFSFCRKALSFFAGAFRISVLCTSGRCLCASCLRVSGRSFHASCLRVSGRSLHTAALRIAGCVFRSTGLSASGRFLCPFAFIIGTLLRSGCILQKICKGSSRHRLPSLRHSSVPALHRGSSLRQVRSLWELGQYG